MSDALPPVAGREFADPQVSVVLPAFNESGVIRELVAALHQALDEARLRHRLIFVNDGSTDATGPVLDTLAGDDERLQVIHLSRNFGHQAAVQAGLERAAGDVVVLMDSDMQDDPAAIARFVSQWREGYDVVYAVRASRQEGFVKRSLFRLFYRLLNGVSDLPIPKDAGNFGLMDRRVVREIVRLGDMDRYFPGLRRWVGFRQTGVPVPRLARYDGRPRVSMRGLWRLAKSAVFSFSGLPLTIFHWIAGLGFGVFLALLSFTLYHKTVTGEAIPGWTSQLLVASFFGALNAAGIGMLGEYVIRIYHQVRRRPTHIVARTVNLEESPEG